MKLPLVVESYPISIETRSFKAKSYVTVPFTLYFEGRTLQGEAYTDHTLTPLEGVQYFLHLINVGQRDPVLAGDMGQQMENALNTFLGKQLFEIVSSAYFADEQERMQQFLLQIRPDPPHIDEDQETHLKRLAPHHLSFAKRVVFFDNIVVPCIYVGRIEEVQVVPSMETLLCGTRANITLLEADDHEELKQRFFMTYLRGSTAPPAPGIYTWPDNLPRQTFLLPKRPGNLVSFQLKSLHPISLPEEKDQNL